MAWTTPRTWVTGELVTAALMNTHIKDNQAATWPTDDTLFAAWTPTYTNITEGNGSTVARYIQVGSLVHCYYGMTLGSTSTIGTNPRISPPVTIAGVVPIFMPIGNARFTENGGIDVHGSVNKASTTNFAFSVFDTTSTVYGDQTLLGAAIPFTWGNLDKFNFIAIYEAA